MADSELKIVITAEDRASGVLSGVSSKVSGLSQSAEGVSGALVASGAAVGSFANTVKSKAGSLTVLGTSLDKVAKPMTVAAGGIAAAGALVVKSAANYETAFTGVKKTVDGTPQELAAVSKGIKGLAKEIPVSAVELANLAAIGGQLGVQTPNILKFTKTMAGMGVATNLAGEEGAAALAKFVNVSGESMNNVDRIASAIVDLGNNTATTEADIAYMAVRMAKMGKTVGMTSDQTLAYSAALSSMGIEAQAGGSAIGRVWMDIQQAVSNGGEKLEGFAKYSKKSSKEFKEQWGKDASGAFRDLIKGLSESEDKVSALSKLGINGTLDQQAVLALANNYELLSKCLELSSGAYRENTALTKESGAAYATTQSKLKMTMNAITDAGMKWGDILLPEVQKGAQWVGNIAEEFGNLDAGTKRNIISTGKFVVGMAAATKGAAILTKGIGSIVTTGSALASALGPVGLTVAGVTAAVWAGKKAYDAYKTSDLRYSRTVKETSETAVEAAQKYRELYELKKEYDTLNKKISKGEVNNEELDKAKERLEEIKQILSEKFKINVDTQDIDKAYEKVQAAARYEMISKRSDLMSQIGQYSPGDFANLNGKIEAGSRELQNYSDKMTKITEAEATVQNLSEAWSKLTAEEKNNKDVQKGFSQSLNAAAQAGGLSPDLVFSYNEFGKVLGLLGFEYQGLITKSNILREEFNNDTETLNNMKSAYEGVAQVGLAEIATGDTTRGFADLSLAIQGANLDIGEYARQTALIQTGQSSLQEVWEAGGETLSNYVNQYVTDMTKLGASATDTAASAALIKNGFENIGQLSGKPQETIQAVERDATNLIKTMDGMQDKSIRIDVETGNISVIDDVTGKIEEIKNNNVDIKIDAEGNISVLDLATGKLQTLSGLGNVHFELTADGNIEILDEAGEKIAEINGKSGEITVNGEYPGAGEIEKAIQDQEAIGEGKQVDITANGSYPGKEEVETALSHQAALHDVNVEYKVTYTQVGTPPKKEAKGTQSFSGGLAMVNDQSGVSDPRELIVDRGRAFIPGGKNVILPLSKGAKVYTASQTKAIMKKLGIPSFASGRDNYLKPIENTMLSGTADPGSVPYRVIGAEKELEKTQKAAGELSEAFKSAKKEWEHLTRIKAVSVTQELEKWVTMSEEFSENAEDVKVIEEEIYSAALKVRDELNELSGAYITDRSEMNDWEDWEDNAIEAFGRVRTREEKYVADGKILERDKNKYLSELGEKMFNLRIENSKNWLEHEVKYNDMSAADYIAGLDRMREYTDEYYKNGLISLKTYYKQIQETEDMRVDKIREEHNRFYDAWRNDADSWKKQRDAYGDWKEFGDSAVEYYQRCIEKEKEFFKLDGDWDKHYGNIIDYQIEMYNANKEILAESLIDYDQYISDVDKMYNDLIKKKREAYEAQDTKEDRDKAYADMQKFKGAVTNRGREAYERAEKDYEKAKRQMEIAALEKKQAEEIKSLRADYARVEEKVGSIAKEAQALGIDVASIVKDIRFAANEGNIAGMLTEILNAVKNTKFSKTTYGNSTININAGGAGIGPFLKSAAASVAGGFYSGRSFEPRR